MAISAKDSVNELLFNGIPVSDKQCEVLMKQFQYQPFPKDGLLERLSTDTGLKVKEISMWFEIQRKMVKIDECTTEDVDQTYQNSNKNNSNGQNEALEHFDKIKTEPNKELNPFHVDITTGDSLEYDDFDEEDLVEDGELEEGELEDGKLLIENKEKEVGEKNNVDSVGSKDGTSDGSKDGTSDGMLKKIKNMLKDLEDSKIRIKEDPANNVKDEKCSNKDDQGFDGLNSENNTETKIDKLSTEEAFAKAKLYDDLKPRYDKLLDFLKVINKCKCTLDLDKSPEYVKAFAGDDLIVEDDSTINDESTSNDDITMDESTTGNDSELSSWTTLEEESTLKEDNTKVDESIFEESASVDNKTLVDSTRNSSTPPSNDLTSTFNPTEESTPLNPQNHLRMKSQFQSKRANNISLMDKSEETLNFDETGNTDSTSTINFEPPIHSTMNTKNEDSDKPQTNGGIPSSQPPPIQPPFYPNYPQYRYPQGPPPYMAYPPASNPNYYYGQMMYNYPQMAPPPGQIYNYPGPRFNPYQYYNTPYLGRTSSNPDQINLENEIETKSEVENDIEDITNNTMMVEETEEEQSLIENTGTEDVSTVIEKKDEDTFPPVAKNRQRRKNSLPMKKTSEIQVLKNPLPVKNNTLPDTPKRKAQENEIIDISPPTEKVTKNHPPVTTFLISGTPMKKSTENIPPLVDVVEISPKELQKILSRASENLTPVKKVTLPGTPVRKIGNSTPLRTTTNQNIYSTPSKIWFSTKVASNSTPSKSQNSIKDTSKQVLYSTPNKNLSSMKATSNQGIYSTPSKNQSSIKATSNQQIYSTPSKNQSSMKSISNQQIYSTPNKNQPSLKSNSNAGIYSTPNKNPPSIKLTSNQGLYSTPSKNQPSIKATSNQRIYSTPIKNQAIYSTPNKNHSSIKVTSDQSIYSTPSKNLRSMKATLNQGLDFTSSKTQPSLKATSNQGIFSTPSKNNPSAKVTIGQGIYSTPSKNSSSVLPSTGGKSKITSNQGIYSTPIKNTPSRQPSTNQAPSTVGKLNQAPSTVGKINQAPSTVGKIKHGDDDIPSSPFRYKSTPLKKKLALDKVANISHESKRILQLPGIGFAKDTVNVGRTVKVATQAVNDSSKNDSLFRLGGIDDNTVPRGWVLIITQQTENLHGISKTTKKVSFKNLSRTVFQSRQAAIDHMIKDGTYSVEDVETMKNKITDEETFDWEPAIEGFPEGWKTKKESQNQVYVSAENDFFQTKEQAMEFIKECYGKEHYNKILTFGRNSVFTPNKAVKNARNITELRLKNINQDLKSTLENVPKNKLTNDVQFVENNGEFSTRKRGERYRWISEEGLPQGWKITYIYPNGNGTPTGNGTPVKDLTPVFLTLDGQQLRSTQAALRRVLSDPSINEDDIKKFEDAYLNKKHRNPLSLDSPMAKKQKTGR